MTSRTIAHTELIARWPDGREIPFAIVVEAPHESADGWTCAVALRGLEAPYAPIAGEDSLQALTLGLRFLRSQLRAIVAKGGALFDADGEPCPIDAYFT